MKEPRKSAKRVDWLAGLSNVYRGQRAGLTLGQTHPQTASSPHFLKKRQQQKAYGV